MSIDEFIKKFTWSYFFSDFEMHEVQVAENEPLKR